MRIALGIEYNGHDFFGWQHQENRPTIQGALESALSRIADKPVKLFCAGRTDAGVHATHQVAHFDTDAIRSIRAWTMGANTHLPPAIAIKWAQEVDEHFHARFSAIARSYRYIIYNSSLRPAIRIQQVTWQHKKLDAALMHQAAQFLVGEQDFTSFRSAECESKSPMRNVHFVQVKRQQQYVVIDIQANAFLHHMVRNIVGALMRVGSGLEKPDWIQRVLQAKDRRQAAETAPPTGLYLCKVHYPSPYLLETPEESVYDLLLPD